MENCVFCNMPKENYVMVNDWFYAIYDKYPVSPGHLLVIPKRHVETLFDLSDQERNVLFSFIEECKMKIDAELQPDAFNFGINQGEAAGQTVPHLHLHIIPRYLGDMEEPEGGVRGVIPEKQKYSKN